MSTSVICYYYRQLTNILNALCGVRNEETCPSRTPKTRNVDDVPAGRTEQTQRKVGYNSLFLPTMKSFLRFAKRMILPWPFPIHPSERASDNQGNLRDPVVSLSGLDRDGQLSDFHSNGSIDCAGLSRWAMACSGRMVSPQNGRDHLRTCLCVGLCFVFRHSIAAARQEAKRTRAILSLLDSSTGCLRHTRLCERLLDRPVSTSPRDRFSARQSTHGGAIFVNALSVHGDDRHSRKATSPEG